MNLIIYQLGNNHIEEKAKKKKKEQNCLNYSPSGIYCRIKRIAKRILNLVKFTPFSDMCIATLKLFCVI